MGASCWLSQSYSPCRRRAPVRGEGRADAAGGGVGQLPARHLIMLSHNFLPFLSTLRGWPC